MKKQVFLGTNEYNEDVFVTIEIKDGVLSIRGVIGPKGNGDATGGCGQIYDSISIQNYAPNWNKAKIDKLIDIWKRWHLNDMNAGVYEQEQAIREWKESDNYDKHYRGYNSWYAMACEYLESIDLLYIDGYKYGSSWIKEELPERIYDWFNSIPETTKNPPKAWVD